MTSNHYNNPQTEFKKILVMGLENSGKSTVILNMMGKTSLLHIFSIVPTKGPNIINFNLKNTDFNIWDLGGQEIYREEYLKNFKNYIKDTKEIFFVIDILDTEKYDLALSYLQEIIDKIRALNNSVDLTLFLHKYDPGYKEFFPDLTEEIIDEFIVKIKKIIPKNIFSEIYKTNIHSTFDRTHIF